MPRLWTRHILNSAIAAPYFSGRAVDVGSGAGLPGLVLAIARPDVEWTLIEPMERRTAWLSEQVAELELENVTVARMRGEEWSEGRVFDVGDGPRGQRSAHASAVHRSPWSDPVADLSS